MNNKGRVGRVCLARESAMFCQVSIVRKGRVGRVVLSEMEESGESFWPIICSKQGESRESHDSSNDSSMTLPLMISKSSLPKRKSRESKTTQTIMDSFFGRVGRVKNKTYATPGGATHTRARRANRNARVSVRLRAFYSPDSPVWGRKPLISLREESRESQATLPTTLPTTLPRRHSINSSQTTAPTTQQTTRSQHMRTSEHAGANEIKALEQNARSEPGAGRREGARGLLLAPASVGRNSTDAFPGHTL